MGNTGSSSSAARRGSSGGPPGLAWVIVGGVLVFVAILVVFRPGRGPDEEPAPAPSATEPAVAAPAAAATATPAVGMPFPDESPTPTVTATPPPSTESCLALNWHAELRQGSDKEVPVEVTVANQCARALQSVSLRFQVNGSRDGEVKGSAEGSFSGSLGEGESAALNIRLPGVKGGYDSISVQPLLGPE